MVQAASRAKNRAFFALSAGQKKGREGSFPILVYNPHPFPITTTVECELQPAWPYRKDSYGIVSVSKGRNLLPAQAEQEESNINEDHRKRVVFHTTLPPSQMSRFDCEIRKVKKQPAFKLRERNGKLQFRTKKISVTINTRTGLLDRYRVSGIDYLEQNAARPLVMHDDADPWGINVKQFRSFAGRFKRMSQTEAALFAGVQSKRLPAVRVIEDGPVRAVVEALFTYNHSAICQRYKLPRVGTEVEIETRVYWQEKDSMLKLSIPTPWSDCSARGQVAYGVESFQPTGNEYVAQKWLAVESNKRDCALTVVNDCTYGFDIKNGELRLSLLRGAAHSAHPTGTDRPLVKPNRFTQRIDQNDHLFRFWLHGGPKRERLVAIDREALVHNEKPIALSYWPSGSGELPDKGPGLSDRAIQITAFKRAEGSRDLIVRLFEPTGRRRTTTLSIPALDAEVNVSLNPFEIKTLRLSRRTKRFREVDLLEK